MAPTHPTLALALLALAAPLRLRAQQASSDTTHLEPVVVTATRVPVAQAARTATTTVITGDELRARGLTTVADALRELPGATVARTGGMGGVTSLFLRGGESDYVQVLIDGVAVNEPGGAFDFASLTTDNIDRIEIVRGPASVLYGSSAVTGVIQIFTRTGSGAPHVEGSVRGGTYGTRDYTGALVAGGDRMSASVAGGHHVTDGIHPFNSAWRDDVVSAALRLAPTRRSDVRLSTRYTDAITHIPTDFTGAVVDSNQFRTEQRWATALDAGYDLTSRLAARVLLGASTAHLRSANFQDSPGDPDFVFDVRSRVDRRSADGRLVVSIDPMTALAAGGAYEAEHQRTFDGGGAANRYTRAGYVQAAGTVRGAFSYTLGGRIDDNNVYGTFRTYRVAAGYRLPTATRVRGSLGTAFKAPTFDESSGSQPFNLGNPDLRPERTRSWEGGIEQELANGRATLAATYFDQRFRDLIQYTPTPPTPGAPNYFNLAAAKASGVELTASVAPLAALTLRGAYTFLHTEVTNAGADSGANANFVKGARLLRRPSRLASLTAVYRVPRRGSISVTTNYVGPRDDRDFSVFPQQAVRLPAYTTVDLAGELTVVSASATARALTLTLRAENLFDRTHQEIFGYDTPGRTVLVGVKTSVGW